MADISDDELREKIQGSERTIEATLDIWDRIPPERKPYTRFGLNARSIAVSTLLLGDVPRARRWFAESSEWYRKSREDSRGGLDEPQMLLWTLLTAILSGDEETISEAVESADTIENPDPAYFALFDRCLSGLLEGHDGAVLTSADELADREDAAAETLDYYAGLGTACAGAATGDAERLDRGLSDVLDRHEELIPVFGKTMDDGLLCYPAAALVVLASRSDLPPETLDALGSKYVPGTLVE